MRTSARQRLLGARWPAAARRRALASLVGTALAGLLAAAPAGAEWFEQSRTVRWPSRLSLGADYYLSVPATDYEVEVELDGRWLTLESWNTFACGSRASRNRAFARAHYGYARTRVFVRLRTGWFCSYPRAGTYSRLTVWYWLD